MKTSIKYLAGAALTVAALSSCSSDEPLITDGEGKLFISTALNTDVTVRSRASIDELRESCIVWISNSKGLVRHFDTPAEIPADGVPLMSGHYIAEAWAGDSVPASFEDRYFKGRQEFDITKGNSTAVEIICTIANSLVAVNYDATVAGVLTDCVMTVGHSQGSLDFVGETDAKGYFMMNSRDKDLTWTLTGKKVNGETYTRTGTIEDCKPATLYSLNVKCTPSDSEIGGAYLTIEVDETAVEMNDLIIIETAPKIAGYNFDITQPIRAEKGKVGRRSVFITASTALESVTMSCPVFGEKLGIDGNDFEIFGMDETLKPTIEQGGVTYTYEYDETRDMSSIKINFEERFTNTLADGEYPIDILVIDKNGKSAGATLTIVISDAPVSTAAVNTADVWATHATIAGTINKADVTGAKLLYRAQGTQGWTDAATDANGNSLTAELTGLTPGTTYEYVAATEDFIGADVMTFTTEAAAQMPNCGFEDWSMDGKIQLAAPSKDNKFWDSGNTGAATLNKNCTEPESDIKHSGNYSARLKSQFVGIGLAGKFAAGNIFVGEYLRTDGMDGVLGWGRTWSSRPTKLHGYAKYTPVAVTHEDSEYTNLKKGDMDNGIIYIALLDNSVMQSDEGKSYPVIIKTKKSARSLFNKDASNVIAYGELVFKEATAGSGMIEFEIPLTYNRTDVKPSYIMCTASASIGGDYFVGGNGSILYLDDLELIY